MGFVFSSFFFPLSDSFAPEESTEAASWQQRLHSNLETCSYVT